MKQKSNRIQKLRAQFSEIEIDGILISQPENRCYLSGFSGSDGFLLITDKEQILATDSRYTEQAKDEAPDYNIFRITGTLQEWFPRLIGDLPLKKLGFESQHITFNQYRQLSDIVSKEKPDLKLSPVNAPVESLRAVKEPEEIKCITQAVKIADDAFNYIEDTIDIGITEIGLAWEIEKFIRDQGSQNIPFEIIVASGPNAAMPHARPSSRTIKSGDCLVIDIGAKTKGYCSDLTRTICPGKRLNKQFKKIYDVVLNAQLTALNEIKSGMTGTEADRLARNVIQQAGYGDSFGHGLGHGIGLVTHEKPHVGPTSSEKLTNGMVFTVEPGIYISEWGGVRIEDTVIMENDKVRPLSQARKL